MRTLERRPALAAGIALLALAPTLAHAAEADAPLVTVTAAKKAAAEDPQAVPLALTTLSADELDSRQVRALSDLTHAAPGVSLDQVGTFRGTANWSIRGLGINSSIASIDPAVGTFVDGVYLGINPGASLDLFDLKAVTVLRGPQGTLYGRNTTGGAVLVETNDPSAQAVELHVRASADGPVDGGRGALQMTGSAVVNLPLGADAAVRLGVYQASDGGYFRNLKDGNHIGAADTTVLRGGVALTPGDLSLVAKLEWLKTDGDGAVGQNHGQFARDSFDVSLDNPGFIRARSWLGTLNASLPLGPGKLTNVFGWRNFRQFTSNDIDSSPQFLFHSNTGLTQEQWSNELRWAAPLGDTVDLTVGGYWFQQDVVYEEDRTLPTTTALKFYGGGRQAHEVLGSFAEATWRLAPALALTAGLRWSHERKDASVTFVRTRAACSVIAGTCPVTGTNPTIPGDPNGFSDARSWNALSPKLQLAFTPADGVLAYAGWTRGNRSGGYNLRVTSPAAFLANAAVAGTPSYDAERVDSFEGGLKLGRGPWTLNLAAYQTDVKGMQREVSVSNGGSGLAQSIYNTADARIRGFEAEGRITLTPGVALSANVGHIDARYTKAFFDISGDGAVGAADLALALPRAPRWTWGGTFEASRGALSGRIAFQHRSRYAYTDSNFGWIPASDSLDADLALALPVAGWKVSLYGRNLLDEVQFGGDTQIPFGAGALSDGNNAPFDPRPSAGTFSPLAKGRTVGVALAIDW